MTDWIAQAQEGVDRWLETQRQWLDAMLGGGSADNAAGATEDLQRRTIEAWRQGAYQVVDAQAQMLLGALRDGPPANADALVRQWTDAQRQMWTGWLAVAGQGGAGATPAAASAPDVAAAGKQMVDALREAAERLVESQAEWAKTWSEQAGKRPKDPPS